MALAFRIVGAVTGLSIAAWAVATSSWSSGWVLVLFGGVVVGGAISYHLLTSMVRCPSCRSGMVDFGIGPVGARQKTFSCRRCGARAWLVEGFYWQGNTGGDD